MFHPEQNTHSFQCISVKCDSVSANLVAASNSLLLPILCRRKIPAIHFGKQFDQIKAPSSTRRTQNINSPVGLPIYFASCFYLFSYIRTHWIYLHSSCTRRLCPFACPFVCPFPSNWMPELGDRCWTIREHASSDAANLLSSASSFAHAHCRSSHPTEYAQTSHEHTSVGCCCALTRWIRSDPNRIPTPRGTSRREKLTTETNESQIAPPTNAVVVANGYPSVCWWWRRHCDDDDVGREH